MTLYEMERFRMVENSLHGAHSYWLECMGLYETRYIMYESYVEPEAMETIFRSSLLTKRGDFLRRTLNKKL